jgi:hypothetical protein
VKLLGKLYNDTPVRYNTSVTDFIIDRNVGSSYRSMISFGSRGLSIIAEQVTQIRVHDNLAAFKDPPSRVIGGMVWQGVKDSSSQIQ